SNICSFQLHSFPTRRSSDLFSNTDKVSYMDCAFVVPIKYEDKLGGYYFYEYENDDRAIAAGRDLWGYPKKYADIELVEENGQYLDRKSTRLNSSHVSISYAV